MSNFKLYFKRMHLKLYLLWWNVSYSFGYLCLILMLVVVGNISYHDDVDLLSQFLWSLSVQQISFFTFSGFLIGVSVIHYHVAKLMAMIYDDLQQEYSSRVSNRGVDLILSVVASLIFEFLFGFCVLFIVGRIGTSIMGVSLSFQFLLRLGLLYFLILVPPTLIQVMFSKLMSPVHGLVGVYGYYLWILLFNGLASSLEITEVSKWVSKAWSTDELLESVLVIVISVSVVGSFLIWLSKTNVLTRKIKEKKMNQQSLKVTHLKKSFKGVTVFENVNLILQPGKIYGFSGPNGCGKSVFFKTLCGFLKADEGEIFVGEQCIGKDIDFLPNVGVLIEKPGFIESMTHINNLKVLAALNNVISLDKIKNVLEMFGFDLTLKTKVKNFSLGMRQKLGIAQAIMEDQSIIVLDEPFNGLDESSVVMVKHILKSLKEANK